MKTLSRDNLPHFADCALRRCRLFTDTRAAALLARWWGINLGRDCKFYGLPRFRRLPGSRIRIADGCEFRSAAWSNYVGVNRPCILSTLSPAAVIEIGRECGFSGTVIGAATRISIGDRVMCGANVTITDTDWHAVDPAARAAGAPPETAPVAIEDEVWLGMDVIVLKGVRIGRGAVVAAASVVTRSLPAGVVAAGMPARVIREIGSGGQTRTLLAPLHRTGPGLAEL